MKIMYVDCGFRNEYESDLRSNEHYLGSCESKARKKKAKQNKSNNNNNSKKDGIWTCNWSHAQLCSTFILKHPLVYVTK